MTQFTKMELKMNEHFGKRPAKGENSSNLPDSHVVHYIWPLHSHAVIMVCMYCCMYVRMYLCSCEGEGE